MSKTAIRTLILCALAIALVSALVPTPAHAAGVDCTANPSTVVVGDDIHIECTGFDPNVYVNAYVVEENGFAEWGRFSYSVCLIGERSRDFNSAKTNEAGTAFYTWYTQDGDSDCPITSYHGYANQLGNYTVVIQQVDGKGGIKSVDSVNVTLTGNGNTYTGAILSTDGPGISGEWLTVYGSGFAPNQYVNIWFTRPQSCAGLGDWYYTGVSAFSPFSWSGGGVAGQDSVKTDANGSFVAPYQLVGASPIPNAYPCLGQWHVTAHQLSSDLGAVADFAITGHSITETAKVWTLEDRVSSAGQHYGAYDLGVAVHVYGSGFPAGSTVTCWFTRPDGTLYHGWTEQQYNQSMAAKVGADGTFSGLPVTWSSEVHIQGEQPGTWAVTCGTADQKYIGIAHFLVYPEPLIDP